MNAAPRGAAPTTPPQAPKPPHHTYPLTLPDRPPSSVTEWVEEGGQGGQWTDGDIRRGARGGMRGEVEEKVGGGWGDGWEVG